MTICIKTADTGKLRAKLPPTITLVDGDAATDAFNQFKIDSTPVVVVYRDGYVVGSAHGGSAESVETVRLLLWSAAAGPDGFRLHRPQPVSFEPHQKVAVSTTSESEGGPKT